jgi:gamma-glutamylcyclotransferase
VHYFAYGSNMNWEQMQRRCPTSQFICVARLPDYRFAIARHSQLRQCGTANIFIERGNQVWGIVYHVSDQDLMTLDNFEDGYCREKVLVYARGEDQQTLEVLVYIAAKEENVPRPHPEYKYLMISGARYWELPAEYVSMLERIEVAEP